MSEFSVVGMFLDFSCVTCSKNVRYMCKFIYLFLTGSCLYVSLLYKIITNLNLIFNNSEGVIHMGIQFLSTRVTH